MTSSAVFVLVTIKEDRIDDFLETMEEDATKSRDQALDPGCLRFDLLRDRDNSTNFVFYEAFTDDEAVAHHKTTDHYKKWAGFKASGGVESQSAIKVDTTSVSEWAFDDRSTGSNVSSAVLVTVDVCSDRIEEFLKAMETDVKGSRDKELDPGCMRFDLLRDRANPNRFFFYEAYVDDDAFAQHKTTAHFKPWAEFKKSGGVVNQSVVKLETASIPGGWAFQPAKRQRVTK